MPEYLIYFLLLLFFFFILFLKKRNLLIGPLYQKKITKKKRVTANSFPEAFKDLPADGRDQEIIEAFRITCNTYKSDWDVTVVVTRPKEIASNFTALLSILGFKITGEKHDLIKQMSFYTCFFSFKFQPQPVSFPLKSFLFHNCTYSASNTILGDLPHSYQNSNRAHFTALSEGAARGQRR